MQFALRVISGVVSVSTPLLSCFFELVCTIILPFATSTERSLWYSLLGLSPFLLEYEVFDVPSRFARLIEAFYSHAAYAHQNI